MRVVFEGLLKAVGVPPVRRVPMVVISGTIGEGRGGRVSARNLTPLLVRAFTSSSPEVVLSINSPGGSPAQSSQIYRAIMTLKQEHKKRVTAFVSDMAASGGYYVACAADEIIVDENSVRAARKHDCIFVSFSHALTDCGIDWSHFAVVWSD